MLDKGLNSAGCRSQLCGIHLYVATHTGVCEPHFEHVIHIVNMGRSQNQNGINTLFTAVWARMVKGKRRCKMNLMLHKSITLTIVWAYENAENSVVRSGPSFLFLPVTHTSSISLLTSELLVPNNMLTLVWSVVDKSNNMLTTV
jgi:hypothetical protein